MTKYREILRLNALGLSQRNIANSCSVSKTTVNRVLKRAAELNLQWPVVESKTESILSEILFSTSKKNTSDKRQPNYAYIRGELLKNGVSKKLLWAEYMEECRLSGETPFMYSQFCRYLQEDEQNVVQLCISVANCPSFFKTGTMVVMSIESYSKLTEDTELSLDVADNQAISDQTRYSHEEMFKKIRKKING